MIVTNVTILLCSKKASPLSVLPSVQIIISSNSKEQMLASSVNQAVVVVQTALLSATHASLV